MVAAAIVSVIGVSERVSVAVDVGGEPVPLMSLHAAREGRTIAKSQTVSLYTPVHFLIVTLSWPRALVPPGPGVG
jgi:hypothetical protein